MWWTWLVLALAEPPPAELDTSGKPEGPLPGEPAPQGLCRPSSALTDALQSVTQPLRPCLRGATFRPAGPTFTFAPDGTVTAQTNTDDPARDTCANEAVAKLKLPQAECTVIVSYPLR
jgi:hypothetical protein